MLDRIFPHNWMALKASTREKLREILGIEKSGQTDVRTEGGGESTLVSDGVNEKDLSVITKKLLEEKLGIDPAKKDFDFPLLWNMLVKQVEAGKVDKPVEDVEKTDLDTGDNGVVEDKHEESAKEEAAKE